MASLKSVSEIINAAAINLTVKELSEDLESPKKYPNRFTRPVNSGHFVSTKPEKLAKPFLIAYTPSLLRQIGLSERHFLSKDLIDIFSGNTESLTFQSWATPYAVSVHGNPIVSPDQFGGYAYGDGRAMSIFHVNDLDVQLKGSGRTPFSRSFDGRAVLRSSIREFLVSELMHNLRVPTTRALTLVSSFDKEDFVPRAWYQESNIIAEADETFQHPPNRMIRERCAISSRSSSSFFRIGHIELFSRRMRGFDEEEKKLSSLQLKQLLTHVIKRHFPSIKLKSVAELSFEHIYEFLSQFAKKEAFLVCQWERVGFVQGNMNSDNMLLNGCTLDYGPFGFLEQFNPVWNPFTSDPAKNYGFLNQARASHLNFATLADAILPLVEEMQVPSDKEKIIELIRVNYPEILNNERFEMRRSKLGLREYDASVEKSVFSLIFKFLNNFDYTMFWRILSSSDVYNCKQFEKATDSELVRPLEQACYTENYLENEDNQKKVAEFIRAWLNCAKCQAIKYKCDLPDKQLMKGANPKYVGREWLLVEAYNEAKSLDITEDNMEKIKQRIDPNLGVEEFTDMSIRDLWINKDKIPFGKLYALQILFSNPYEDQNEIEDIFFRKTPANYVNKPGTSFYS